MLIETRMQQIVAMVEEKKSVTVQELMVKFSASESTVRRDLNSLHRKGLLIKVHGGAIAKENHYNMEEPDVVTREGRFVEEKDKIAKYAASLIKPYDHVYIDSGTTTVCMIDYITEKNVSFVTNGLSHAKKLASRGYSVYLLGGKFKGVTESVIGDEAVASLAKYNFTKGFFGCNGITITGVSTPDVVEGALKAKAVSRCKEVFILCDHSKFGQISSVKFAEFTKSNVIIDKNEARSFEEYDNVTEV